MGPLGQGEHLLSIFYIYMGRFRPGRKGNNASQEGWFANAEGNTEVPGMFAVGFGTRVEYLVRKAT